jgi:ParB-like chromosome segregation protein Spo0J
MTGAPWQLLPGLSAEEYAALKADIAAHGVRVPVVTDAETGAVVDGHHRVQAVEELRTEGVRVDYVRQSVRFADDEERVGFVLAANLFRRHLTRAQRAEVVAGLRQRGWSLRRIGEAVGASKSSVERDLSEVPIVPNGTIPERVERRGGGSYPARRPRPPASVMARSAREEARAAAALSVLGDEVVGLTDLRRAEDLARKANLARRRAEDVPAVSEGTSWELRCGDVADVFDDVPDCSVDAIVTDPPYDVAGLPLYSTLSSFAARVLKPGRLCVAYVGKLDLPETMARLGEHLTYAWCGAVFLPGRHAVIRARMIRARWRPVLMFSAGPYEPRTWMLDTFTSEGGGAKAAAAHPWQQTVGPFVRLVEQVTRRGELVVDPFAGSGTTGLACLATGRRFLGADIDAGAVSLATERLGAFEHGELAVELPEDDDEAPA